MRRYGEAIDDLNEAIRLDPQYEPAWCNRASACLGKGEYDKALADCTKSLELDPQCPWAQMNKFLAVTNARLKKAGGSSQSKVKSITSRDAGIVLNTKYEWI